MARELAAEPGAPRMPGDPRDECDAERRAAGIPIEPQLMREFAAWSQRLGTTPLD